MDGGWWSERGCWSRGVAVGGRVRRILDGGVTRGESPKAGKEKLRKLNSIHPIAPV